MTELTAASQPKRILLLAMHPGYVRYYEGTLRLMLAAGHEVHLTFANSSKQSTDRIAERLANEYVNLVISQAPKSPRGNVDNLRRGLRALADYMRYQHPRYADAQALRARAASKLLWRRDRQGLLPAVAITLYLPTFGRLRHAGYADRGSRWALHLANNLPAPTRATRWMRTLDPDVVLTTPHVAIGSADPEFLDAARALRIPSALLVASWDNLTNKGLIKSPTDLVVVWNESQRVEARELHGVPDDRIVVTGAQRFDEWFEMSASTSRETFLERVGLDPDKAFILYLCSSPFVAPDEVPFVQRLIGALRASGGPLAQAGVLIRPHPQNAAQWVNSDVSEHGNAVVWPREGEQPVRVASKQGFYDSIHHSLSVVGINTSAQIEAAIVGRTVHTVLDRDFAHAHEGTLHFRHLLVENGGLLYVAGDLPELLSNLESVLEGGLRGEHASRFVANFIRPYGIDRPASENVAAAIVGLAERAPRSRVKVARALPGERLLLGLLVLLSVPMQRDRIAMVLRDWLRAVPGRVAAGARARGGLLARRGRAALAHRLLEPGQQIVAKPPRPAKRAVSQLVVLEPWTGDLAGEILYWIPVVRRYVRTVPRGTRIAIALTGSDPRWYATVQPDVVLDARDLGLDEWSRDAVTALLRTRGETGRVRFYGPANSCDALSSGIRADSMPWAAHEKATEVRSVLPRAGRAAEYPIDWTAITPSLVDDLLRAAQAKWPMTIILQEARGGGTGTQQAVEVDSSDRVALTTALDEAVFAMSTDIGVAALSISMCVETTLVHGVEPNADLDILDRVAVAHDVRLEIVDPDALRLLVVGDRAPTQG